MCLDGTAFQQLIAAVIAASLNGALWAYGMVAAGCVAMLTRYSALLTT